MQARQVKETRKQNIQAERLLININGKIEICSKNYMDSKERKQSTGTIMSSKQTKYPGTK